MANKKVIVTQGQYRMSGLVNLQKQFMEYFPFAKEFSPS
jgi:hypothetical protein